ncbi:hypothetical protein COY95_02690 [Candidatus Woesearchaeota archaeon CG_4_10_14_0_8_um_filter_47_5]|nr:MAG: hypothetical protein COY95_02690 [Candidatus Woesearchaeota archaeon CG_4_10_14_0_8_um_filter_47_5]
MIKVKIQVREALFEAAQEVHEKIPEFEKEYLTERFRERCQDGRNTEDAHALVLVAYLDDAMLDHAAAGYLIGYDRFMDGSFYVWMAGVVPGHRRKGVLSAMMGYAEEWARGRGFFSLKIKTRNSRREILEYLVKHGFNIIWFEKRENARDSRVLMQKTF